MEAARTQKMIEDLLKQGAEPDELHLHYVDVNGGKGELKPSTFGRKGLLEALDYVRNIRKGNVQSPAFTLTIT